MIDAAAIALRKDLSTPKRDPKASAERLFRLVMKPAAPILGGARSIFLSSDGALTMVPFEALINDDVDYIIDRYAFDYLTSGRDLMRLAAPAPPPEAGPVVIADPDFGPASGAQAGGAKKRGERSIDMGKVRFPPLPGTAAEGAAITSELPGARLLAKGAATEAALRAIRRPKILHIATHGFFLPDQPRDQGADKGASPASRGLVLESLTPLRIENPLLRAGLALRRKPSEQRGRRRGVDRARGLGARPLWNAARGAIRLRDRAR